MGTKTESPKAGYFGTPAKDPKSPTGNVTALVSREKVERLLKYGPAHKFYESFYCVRETLSDPHAIFPYNEDEWTGYCYTRKVENRYTNAGSQVPVEDGFTFAVFVTDTMKVIEWGFEPAKRDHEDTLMNDRQGRLRDAIWRR
jgi:hypothetical protein